MLFKISSFLFFSLLLFSLSQSTRSNFQDMSQSSILYQGNSGNVSSVNVSPMVLEFSSVVNLDSTISDNSQQRHHHHEHPPHSETQHRQAPTQIRLPSFSSLISGTRDPLIPDCHHLLHAIAPPPQAECSTLPTGSAQLPSSIATTTSPYPQRWSTPTDRSLQHAFAPPPTSARPTSQSLHRFASSTLPLNQAYSTSPTTDHAYLHHNQSRLQNKHASTTNLRTATPIDAPDLTTTAAVTGSSIQSTNKSRRTRKSKFLNQVGTCVLGKSARWTTKKDRNSNSNIEGGSSIGSSSSSCNSMTSQTHNHHLYHRRHSQQQDCTPRRLSTTTITTSSGLMPPPSSTVSIPPLGTSSSSSSSSTSIAKPRWQETERLDLLKAIVKEKHLDDMTSFSWDRISLVVGRAKKACKDQWRREILPALLEKLK